jgi:Uma2 family endonuclease
MTAPAILPRDTVFDLQVDRQGPIRAADFEAWTQEEGNPVELVEGWVLPMSPGNFRTGELLSDLAEVLGPLARQRGWRLSLDARHRLPQPLDTVVFPDIALHCTGTVAYLPGTQTVGRVPELVVEILGEETAGRDRGPRGAKFLAYQWSGVREYFHAWPDGSEAAGYRLQDGAFIALPADEDGFFESAVLGCRVRLSPAAIRK